MSEASVVLYGASGYTGKHVAWKLAEKGIPFVAAGRNKERLAKQLGEMPELAEAEYEIVAVDHDEAALTTLFEGKEVVHNLVGPFMQLGEPVVRAALNAGVHYLDTTGEQDWMLHVREVYGPQFERKGRVLSPACASMWTSGMMVAELVLEREGIDSVDIVYTLHGVPSVSSTLSFMRMCCQPQHHLSGNELVAWPPATGVSVSVPGIHEVLTAVPWSGGGESVWFQHDPRVRNCSTLVAFRNQMLMGMVVAKMTEFDESYAHLPAAEQEAVTNAWAMEIAPQGEPPREDFDVHRVLFTCHGRGTLDAHSVAVWGATGYVMAGIIGATTIEALLLGRQQVGGGFSPATTVVGARHLLNAMIAAGICGQPKELIV
jgi:hypothetical protein